MSHEFKDEELAEAMALLASQASLSDPPTGGPPLIESPTLAKLPQDRRPKPPTACETCRNSVWFASTLEVRCYCRVMFHVTWSTETPNHILNCDGQYLT